MEQLLRPMITRELPLQARPPRFANTVLILTMAWSAAWFLYTILGHKPYLYQKLAPAAVALSCLLLLRCSAAVREVGALSLIGVLGGLYAAEWALGSIDQEGRLRRAYEQEAVRSGIPFDSRPRIQVIAELRRQGVAAYPGFYPYLMLTAPCPWMAAI